MIAALRVIAAAIAVVACLGAGGAGPSDDAADQRREHWYVLRLAEVDCGWMRTATVTDGARIVTEMELSLTVDRAGATVTIATSMEFVETDRGIPLRLRTVQRTGQDPLETLWEFPEDARERGDVRRVVRQGGDESVGTEVWPAGDWLAPAAAESLFARRRAAGATEVVYATIDGQQGLRPATVRAVRDGDGTHDLDGRVVATSRWRISTSAAPIETTVEFSPDDVMVRSRVDLGFGELQTRLASKAEVRSLRPGRLPDLIAATTIRPSRPIPDVMRTRIVEVRLSMPDGARLPDLPSAGAQLFVRETESTATVSIDIDRIQPASESEVGDRAYSAPSPTIDSDDPVIRTLLARATRGVARGAGAAARAEACRTFVARHVRDKGLDVAFATASEVARRRAGDCSEHAVLLCALLRADGIPARVASGLIYVDSIGGETAVYGWHMWTQALIETVIDGEPVRHWLDLDATLPRRTHAGHLLTGVSSMADGPADPAMTAMLPLMGRLAVEILRVEQAIATPPPRTSPRRPRRRLEGGRVFGRCSPGRRRADRVVCDRVKTD